MKKLIAVLLTLVLMMTCFAPALAEYYHQHQSNEATFETLEEAHANGALWLGQEYPFRNYIPDPALDDYPAGTTYVYRGPGMYCYTTQAARMNTTILVYTDKTFETKDDALAYLTDLGLTAIADEATGSVVLVTPINGKAFAQADQYAFFQLQAAMCNVGFSTYDADRNRFYTADAGYFGGVTYRYLIGIDGGATFINNYVAPEVDFIGRIAAMLLVGGTMEKIRNVADIVPAWLVNPSDMAVLKYREANKTDCVGRNLSDELYYNEDHPIQQVIVTRGEVDLAQAVKTAYYDLFVKNMRVPVVYSGLHTAAKLYSNYSFNQAPYSLGVRNPIVNGRTPDGIVILEKQEERFSDYPSTTGEYVTTWYEMLPEEVLDGTAKEHSIPLVLVNHGGGDDPIQCVDEMGWLTMAGKERLAILAERHGSDVTSGQSAAPFTTMEAVLPAMIRYMLETYPALDPSRVYVTGYSQGGGATCNAVFGAPELFAAAVDQSGQFAPDPEKEGQFESIDMPMLLTTSTYDTGTKWDSAAGHIVQGWQDLFNAFLRYNEIDEVEFDFDTYPMVGFAGDIYRYGTINDEYPLSTYYYLNDEGVPMVGMAVIEFIPHGLYQEYAQLSWNFMRQFSRDPETLEIIYHSNAN